MHQQLREATTSKPWHGPFCSLPAMGNHSLEVGLFFCQMPPGIPTTLVWSRARELEGVPFEGTRLE